jgi:predicted 3-demethylubiquinone-9 3-methyltransferase (glyoxalase superfamily)
LRGWGIFLTCTMPSGGVSVQKIRPCLWFDTQAEEAAQFYASVFPDSEVVKVTRYGEAGPGPVGSVMIVRFRLMGQEFMGLNGGPLFAFSEAVSFVIDCETQDEVDYYWDRLGDGGKPGPCGWVTDRFGLSWQVVPTVLEILVDDPDPEASRRVTEAMLQMGKLVIADLQKAHDGT